LSQPGQTPTQAAGQPPGQAPAQSPQQINIELPADLDAVYSNFAIINHSPSEIVIDFARILPNVPKGKVHARVILTPLNAKLLLQALSDNLDKYQERFGEIHLPNEASFQAPPGLFEGRKSGG
jgi:hypothetical protein